MRKYIPTCILVGVVVLIGSLVSGQTTSQPISARESQPTSQPAENPANDPSFRLLEIQYQPIMCLTSPCPQFIVISNPSGPTIHDGAPYPLEITNLDASKLGIEVGEIVAVSGILENRYAGLMTLRANHFYRASRYWRVDQAMRQLSLVKLESVTRRHNKDLENKNSIQASVQIQRGSVCDLYSGISIEKLPGTAVLRGYAKKDAEAGDICIQSLPAPQLVPVIIDLNQDFGVIENEANTTRALILKDSQNKTTAVYLLVVDGDQITFQPIRN